MKRVLLKLLFVLIIINFSTVMSADKVNQDIIVAVQTSNVSLLTTLLNKKDYDIDYKGTFGDSVLHVAMFQNNLQIIELLIANGYDVNAISTQGNSVLHVGVWADNLPAIKLLIKYGANTHVKNHNNLTPYEQAIDENRTAIARYLSKLS